MANKTALFLKGGEGGAGKGGLQNCSQSGLASCPYADLLKKSSIDYLSL